METKSFDIIVIGAGPGGYTAAVKASKLGKSVACVEKDKLGGVCLNWGCIPTKALLKSAEVYHNIKEASEFGFNINNVSIDFDKIIKRSREVAEKQEKGVAFLFKKNKIEHIKGAARFKDKNTLIIPENGTDFLEIKAENIIIATGARPKSLPNMEIDGKKIISSTEAMTLKTQPKELIIIGAGAIGIEFGYFYSTIGTKVTIIEALPNLLPNEDEEISKTLEREFKKRKINFYTNSFLQSIDKTTNGVTVSFKNSKGEIETLTSEIVLMAVGVKPNTDNINLEQIGVKTEKGFIIVDDNYQTNIKGVYAIGDVIPTPLLAHVASHEAISCVEKISGIKHPTEVNYDAIPGCTYCNPQVASVGFTEKKAISKGYEIKIGKFFFLASGKASAIGDNTGLIKVIFDAKTDKLIGCHIIGPEATELIAEVGLAISNGLTAKQIYHTVHSHPTLSEGIMEACANAYGDSINV